MSKPLVPLVPPLGTAAKIATYVGILGSIIVNTDINTIHVFDGFTAGGFALSKVGHQHTANEVSNWLGYTPGTISSVNGYTTAAITLTTGDLTEVTNLFFTNTRARNAISLTAGNTGIIYSASSGVLDVSSLTSSGVAEGTNKYYTDARARAALSLTAGSSGATYSASTGVLDLSALTASNAAATSAAKLTTARTLSITGDISYTSAAFDGTANVTAVGTLATINTNPGTFGSASAVSVVVVNGKGLVTSVTNTPIAIAANQITSGTFADAVVAQSNVTQYQSNLSIAETQIPVGTLLARLSANQTVTGNWIFGGTLTGTLTGNATSAGRLSTARSISTTGDATWTTSFDGSANATGALTLASVGTAVNAALVKVTTDAKGRVTATTPVVAADITSLVNSTYVSKAGGDTILGALNINTFLQVGVNTINVTTGGVTPAVQIGGTPTGTSPSEVLHFAGYADSNQKQLRIQMNHAGVTTGYLGMGTAPNTLIFGSSPSIASLNPTVFLSLTATGAAVAGTLTVAGSTTLAALSATAISGTNLTISGTLSAGGSTGTSGQVLTSNGASAPSWTAATSTATSLNGTAAALYSTAAAGIYAGATGTSAAILWSASNGGADQKGTYALSTGAGFYLQFVTDNLGSGTNWLSATRSATTATVIALTGTAINLAVGTGGLQLNGSAGSAGQVLTSQGSAAAPIWAAASAPAASALTGTTLASNVVTSSLTSLGTIASLSVTNVVLTGTFSANGSVGTAGQVLTSNGSSAATWSNAGTGTVTAVTVTTSNGVSAAVATQGTTPALTFTLGAITPSSVASTGALSGTSLAITSTLSTGGSTGTAGQVLTSQGASAPSWSTPSFNATVLSATGTISPSSATTGIYAGNGGGNPLIYITNATGAADTKSSRIFANTNGDLNWQLLSDNFGGGGNWLTVTRSTYNPATITLTSTVALNLAVGAGVLQINGASGTAGQMLTSQGSGAAPSWSNPSVAASALTGTTLAANITTSSLTSHGTLTVLNVAGQVQINGSPGTAGQALVSQGASAPIWASVRDIPQNSKSVDYTAVITDAGGHIFHPAADTTARTFTIPANASVAFPIGTALTFVNQNAAGSVTIAITTDTMRLAGAGTTGSRTLAANGLATALKITSTEWIISGTGLT